MKSFYSCLVMSSLFVGTVAQAGSLFQIEITDYGTVPTALRDEVDTLMQELETEVNAELPNADAADPYMKAIANSAVMASSGVGVDYQSPFSLFIVGVQGGLGIDKGDHSISKVIKDPAKAQGASADVAIMAGLNFKALPLGKIGFFDFNRFKGYLHFFKMGVDRKFDGNTLDVDVASFGFHGQYKMIEPIRLGAGLLYWHGLDVTTGYSYTSIDGGMSIPVTKSQQENIPTLGTSTVTFTGTANANAEVSVSKIPIEVSSGVRLGYILSLYGGLGADLAFGKAEGRGSLSETEISVDGGVGSVEATANLDLNAKKGPDFFNLRYFTGVGIEMAVLTPYVQWNQSLSNDTFGLTAGIKGFW